jgi:hypothetical protein
MKVQKRLVATFVNELPGGQFMSGVSFHILEPLAGHIDRPRNIEGT